MEPLYNGQVGAGAFVRYSEVSFIGRFRHIIMFPVISSHLDKTFVAVSSQEL